jgi:hypothetical protein
MSNNGYYGAPNLSDEWEQSGGQRNASTQTEAYSGDKTIEHRRRLMQINEAEQLAAMQAYQQSGQIGAAEAAIARGQAAQQMAAYGASGGLASRQALVGGAGAITAANTAGTQQAQQERLAAMGAGMNVAAHRADYELAAIQADLKQKGIEYEADSRIAEARRAASERERLSREQTRKAVAGAAGAGIQAGGNWASEDDEEDY